MDDKRQDKWYFKTSTLIAAFLCVGPLALPLLWFNPHFGIKTKIIISAIAIILTYYLGVVFMNYLKLLTRVLSGNAM